jgi:3-deoxy-D-manno-octulosonic-acid transferase
MNRFLYSVLLYLVLPLVPLKLLWRGIKQPAYLKHWPERFGFYNVKIAKPVIWLHCVSVGETRAAEPLVQALQMQYPNHQILLTHGTPTGREASEALFADNIQRVYLPYDVPFAVNNFLKHFQPKIGLIMETELWFNLIAACKQREIPLLLLNARLSEKSANGYAKLGKLAREGLQNLSAVAAQTNDDATRLQNLGATNVTVAGNLKFDVKPPQSLIEQGLQLRRLFGEKPIFLAASTREGEEALILDALANANIANLLTILVPRHPQRFDEVAKLLKQRGIDYQRKTSLNNNALQTNTHAGRSLVVLGDSMGEMPMYYAACDVAFIGGSLLNFGGQNLIEAAHLGKPILIGEHTFNFAEACNDAVAAGAAIRVKNADDLMQQLNTLLKNKTEMANMQQAALQFSATYSGATSRLMALIAHYLHV